MLSFYPQFWTQAFDFEGRTSRIDYWKIVLVNLNHWRCFGESLAFGCLFRVCCRFHLPGPGDEHSAHSGHRPFLAVDLHLSDPVRRGSLVALD